MYDKDLFTYMNLCIKWNCSATCNTTHTTTHSLTTIYGCRETEMVSGLCTEDRYCENLTSHCSQNARGSTTHLGVALAEEN